MVDPYRDRLTIVFFEFVEIRGIDDMLRFGSDADKA